MLYNLNNIIPLKIKKQLKKHVSKTITTTIKSNLLIFDDIFPNPLSDWRYNEYIQYLKYIENTHIVTDLYNNQILNKHSNYYEEFNKKNPQYRQRISFFNEQNEYSAKLGYCLFYNNLKKVFPIFEHFSIPFAFTLYPGGGFSIYDKEFETSISQYFKSKHFRHVFVNMPHVYDYISNRFEIDNNKISYLYGAPLNLSLDNFSVNHRDINSINTINVIFCSHKYMQHGIDKGFDIFNRVARFFEGDTRFTFTCIGGFNESDLVEYTENISFKPDIYPEALSNEFSNYDIILSPNRSHVLHFGAFDGFPTGSVLHAAYSGCLMMVSDEMGNAQAIGLENGVDYILIAPNLEMIVDKLLYLFNNRKQIQVIAKNGREKLNIVLDQGNQMNKRIEILSNYL